MSTKIYNGYKLEGVRTLKEMDAFLNRLKKKIKVAQETMMVRKLASLAAEFYDMRSLGWVQKKYLKKHKDSSPLTFALMTMLEAERGIKKNNSRNPDFDFSFEVAFMFQSGYVLCALFTEKDEFTKAWEGMRGVKKYPYWDNTDRPKNVPSAAWRKRGLEWARAVPHSFADAGLVKTIAPPILSYEDKANILKAVPSLDRRLDCYARKLLIHSYSKGKVLKDGQINWSLVRESMDFVRTPRGKEALLNAKKNLKPRIPKRFTIRMLTQPIRSSIVRAV